MRKALAHRAEFYALRGAVAVLRRMKWDRACRLGERIGLLGYAPLGIRREVVERQIAGAFPGLDRDGVRKLARRAYAHLGRSTIETALLSSLGREGILSLVTEVVGWDAIEEAHAAGRGIVIVSGHFGNWELAGAYLPARGVPMDVIVRRQANPLFDDFLDTTRARLGMSVVNDADAVKRTPRALREGRAVGFVSDQGLLGLASTFVPFFGRPARTPRGAAVFALRFGAPVVFITAVRLPSGTYRFIAERVEVQLTGDREADSDAIVRRYTEILEEWVRRAPEQYFWHHRRWRRQPEGTPDELRDPVMTDSVS
ncbi:MAG TPA: lysophospholipid acyltransferase family protein [Gemmatimonadaceae bacterium]|nr:lysophospholipid acyltransferase family protein [Gemmatimonadaceae bacterium]